MYNFLDHKLKPNVVINCPVSDGFEAENLISENNILKSKGFIAYSAIRPPINVDFVFICPIKINYILIWTSAGSQKSTGFEFQAKNSNSDYFTICKTHTTAPGIVLYNRRSFKECKNIPQEFSKQYCKTSQVLSATERIRIRIFKTVNSVPCIGKIEVWGYVSSTCSEITKNTIKQLMIDRRMLCSEDVPKPSSSADCSKKIEFFNIPEEFIDPISCDMMSLPMTLPSGKTVDQSTLEKHQDNEAKWGRCPSDPFTGQIFTSLRRPVLNTALKSRIDKFLLENADNKNTFNIQRTLGRKRISESLNLSKNTSTTQDTVETQDYKCQTSISDDLDDIINKSIKKYNIIRFTETKTNELIKNSCGCCKIESHLYDLPCSHSLCRSCLLISVNSRCKICNVIFSKHQVKKHNT